MKISVYAMENCRTIMVPWEGEMNPSYEFEFMVGETYENEKGIFSVMSIEKDRMVIRWVNGEEIHTSMEFQGRIQKRRQWEKTVQEEKKVVAKPLPRKARSSKSSKQAAATE